MSTGEEQSELEPRHQPSQTEGKTVSPLDSALTHVPESMDVETAGSVTQAPLTNFSTKNSASQISDNHTSPKEGTSSKSTHDQTDCVEKQASNLNKVRQERAPKEKDAVSQDSAALVGKSPRCSTKQKLASQLSSDTGTPSQSILKPISVVAKSVPPSNIHYSDTEKEEDQEPFVAEEDAEVNHKEMELAHKKARSQSHLNPLQIQVADENQTLKEDHTLPEDQTLTEGQTLAESQTLEASVDSSASPQQNSPAEMSKLTKAYEENENKFSDSNQEHSEEEELKKSEPLVVETQYPSTLEEQSISLLSPKVIADSIPVDREEEQSPDRSGKDVHVGTESQETITQVDRSRSFQRSMQKSDSSGTTDLQEHSLIPGFSHPELEQPCPQSGEEVSTFVQGKGTKRLQKEEERSSSPATFSITRKRNSHGQESSIKAKLGHFHTPDLLPLQSPSSSSDKVVNSAPPRTTTIPLDSDDDGAVLIVRRTKRKCFSLDGSPLRPEAPLSTKRRRYGTRQKNLADKFDDLAGNGLCKAKDYEEGGENKVEEKIQPAQPNILQEGQESRQKLAAEKNRPMHVESLMSPSSEAENPEEGVKGNTAEGDRKTDSDPKMPAPSRRRKAVRGLARLSDSTSAEFLPNTRQTRTETASGQPLTSGQTDTNSAEGRHSMTSTTQNSPRILVTLTEAHAEDPMEVEEIDGEMVDLEDEDARANSRSHEDKKVSTEHSEPNETREQCFEAPQAAATKATEGADGNPIVIDQMSVRSQTQKSVNQSSIPPSEEDATIPPSDFDLRFDDEDDDSNNGDDEENEGTITEQEPLVLKVNISQSKEPEHGDQGSTMDVDPSPSEDKEKDIDTPAEGASDQTSIVPGHAGPKPQTSETTVRETRQSLAEARNKRQGSADALQDSEEEEEEVVVVKKKGRRAVIDSDSDSDHNSGAESEASFQLNFTSSSALSSQSEVPTTQERSKMESELDRLRREIAEMEAKLQGRSSSSKSESAGDSCDMNSSVHRRKGGGKSRLTVEDSSDDEVEELSDSPVRSSRKKPKSAGKEQKDSQTKRSRRRRRISSDEEEEEEKKLKVKQRRQQLMDAYVCEVNDAAVDGDDDGVDGRSSAGQGKVHLFSLHTPDKKVKGRADPEVSDEDSSDLFLSPLSPSPPPPTKQSLARKDSYGPPRSLFSVDSPSLSSSVTRIRPSLDFERRGPLPSEKTPVTSDAEWTKYDDIQDSQESEAEVSGSLKNIPESQFSASGGDSAKKKSKKVKYSGEARAAALVSESKQNCGTSVVEPCAVDSSATPLPSLCNAEGDEENKENMDVDENCDRMEDEENDDAVPRWKRKRLGFISSGLDPEKSSVLRKLAEMNECKVYSKFNDSVTHVIMRTNPDSRVCERTLKYFQGIAGQCWVLSFDWVLHSMKAGHFVPEKHYEIHGDTIKGENHCGPSLSRMSTSPLLQGFALASVGASPDMSKKELTQLLTLMGAEVVEDPWDLASHPAKHKLVLRCVDSDTQPPTPAEIELFNGQYKHFGLVTVAREWILDSICTNHLLPLHDYIFNTCKDLRLPF
ncbi:uro-adherence factor A-like [Littorina saxatilis]|uniref:uro-adherence factor A-like n=1 Tax=Littorina saxatilis TaxID=31220 RepID=UPI0038B4920B